MSSRGSKRRIWIIRDYVKCSGCRKCEIACSLFHEKRIWPEASRIRIFMLVLCRLATTLRRRSYLWSMRTES